jgi:Flp pilus assembly secretin CpaC
MKKRFGLAILMLFLAVPGASASEMLQVSLGYSQVVGPVKDMATVIVGNDGVADATLGGGGTIILTGKAIGATNLIVLDASGRELLSSALNVVPVDRRPRSNIRVTKGIAWQDYECGPDDGCMPASGQTVSSSTTAVVGSDDATAAESPETEAETPAQATPETEASVSREKVSLNP